MRYHVNPETGNASPCRAAIKCRFGGPDAHYSSSHEAARAYETSMMRETIPSATRLGKGIWTPTEAEIEQVRGEARALAASMNADADWLPPVDDPEAPEGIDEEEGYVKNLEAFRDPLLAMNNCIAVAEAMSQFTEGEFAYVEHEVGGPYLNIHAANRYRDRQGRDWVIDYTYSQIDPDATWPHVAPLENWQRAVEQAGHRSMREIREQYEQTEDTSYRMRHQPSEEGARADNIDEYYPDFYAHPEWYSTGMDRADRETSQILQRIRNRPDAEVIIYRALPERTYGIHEGNWVTLSRTYAENHAAQMDGSDWPVIEMKVRARDIRTPGDSINEWGYYPSL